jgi:hypothetical protein
MCSSIEGSTLVLRREVKKSEEPTERSCRKVRRLS